MHPLQSGASLIVVPSNSFEHDEMRCNFLELVVVLLSSSGAWCARSQREISHNERRQLRDEVVEAFHHAYGAYMTHACKFDVCFS